MIKAKKKPRKRRETLYKLPLVLDPQPEGGYMVTCPLLPELITEGDTAREALANVADRRARRARRRGYIM